MDPHSTTDGGKRELANGGSASRLGDPPAPPVIPDHELLRPIGRGSYGTVWLARNMMGVYRAVKVVHRSSFSEQRPFERELSGIRKFEPISRSHEGFVDVLHVGINEKEDCFYYVMELGDDQSAGQTIDPANYCPKTLGKEISLRQRLSSRECLELGLGLSQALAELHKHKLVHRDVKPANIIFVNGVPKLADIGLVADANDANSYVGTVGFIPPEGPGTPQADVYGLGKVLYEVSTGKDRQDFPALPTLLNELPERESFLELNEVILHACKNDLKQRYQSAWEMYGDLIVLANGKSLRRLNLLERRLSNLKQIGGLCALALLVLVAIIYQVYRQRMAVMEARWRQDTSYGNAAVEKGDLLGALPYFADALQQKSSDPGQERTFRARFGSTLAQCPKLTYLAFEKNAVRSGVFSPDGNKMLLTPDTGAARIYDIKSGALHLHPFGPDQLLTSATYSHDGRFIVTTTESGAVSIWDADFLTEIHHWPHPMAVFSARFSPDGLRVITACKDGYARVWNLQTDETLFKVKHEDAVLFGDFSPNGKFIVTCSRDHTAKIWNAANGESVGKPLNHGKWVYYASFSPDSKALVTASGDHAARVWSVEGSGRISPDLIHEDAVKSAEFSPDGRLILTASLDATVRLWRTDDFQPSSPNSVLGQGERVTFATFDPEGRRILTTCADGLVRIWDLAGSLLPTAPSRSIFSSDGKRYLQIKNGTIEVRGIQSGQSDLTQIFPAFAVAKVEFNRSGTFIIGISAMLGPSTNCVVQIWDSTTGRATSPGFPLPTPFGYAALSDDGKSLVAFGTNLAQTWDVRKCQPRSPVVMHKSEVAGAFFNSEGSRVVTVSDRTVQVWDSLDGKAAFPPLIHPQPVTHAEYDTGGSRLLSCCSDPSFASCYAQVWDASTGQRLGPQLKHRDGVLFAAFSPDGRMVGTASEDFSAGIWNASTAQRLTALRHHEKVETIAFSPDSKWVVTASMDGTTRVWSAETGESITPPMRDVDGPAMAQFIGNGNRIIAGDMHGNTRIWEIPLDQKPAGDPKRIARLLSSEADIFSGALPSPASESCKKLWDELMAKYPTNFTISTQEIVGWHEFEADDSEKHQQWFAAAFHLKHLFALQPNSSTLIDRITRANEGLTHKR